MNTEAVNGVRGKGNFRQKQQQGAALAARVRLLGPAGEALIGIERRLGVAG